MAALVVTAYIAVWSHEYFPRGSTERAFAMTTHFTVGLSVLLLVMLRLFVRSRQETPLIRPEPPVWQQSAATLAHVALYATMIAMPILGWLTLSAAGKPIPFFGLTLPPLIAENKDLGKQIKEIHETLGTIFYLLIGLHVAAAIYHHVVAKDNTLARMAPVATQDGNA